MSELTSNERNELKKVITAFYKRAGRTWGDRSVNYCVAGTFAIMMNEALKASFASLSLATPISKPGC